MSFRDNPGYDEDFFVAKPPKKHYGPGYINKYAGIAADMKSENPTEDFNAIRENLSVRGEDPLVNQIREESKQHAIRGSQDLAQSILEDPSINPQAKVDMLSTVSTEASEATGNIDKSYIAANLENSSTITPEEEAVALGKMGDEERIHNTSKIMQDQQAEAMLAFLGEHGDITGKTSDEIDILLLDVAELVVTPGMQVAYKNIIEEALPAFAGKLDVSDFFFFGNAKNDVRDYVDSLAPEMRVKVHKDLMDAISNHTGGLKDDNHLEAMWYQMEFTSLLDPTGTYGDGQQAMDNLFGLIEGTVILGGLARVGRGVRAMNSQRIIARDTLLAMKNAAAPRDASELAASVLRSDNLAFEEAVGASKYEIINQHTLMKADGDVIPEGFDLPTAAGWHRAVMGPGSDTSDYVHNAQTRVISDIDQTIKQMVEKNPRIHLSKSSVTAHGDGAEYRVVIGQTDTVGFPTLSSAHRAANSYIEAVDGVEILGRNAAGNLVPFKSIDDQVGSQEFYVRLRSRQAYSKDDVLGLDEEEFVGIQGRAAAFNEVSAQWGPDHVRRAAAAVNMSAKYSTNLQEIMRPFRSLGKTPWDQKRVLQLLEEGEVAGKWFEGAELADRLRHNQRAIKGYNSMREAADTIYYEQNIRLHKQLLEQGFRDTRVGDWNSITKPLDEGELASVRVAYDPATDSFVEITDAFKARMATENKAISRNMDRISKKADENGLVHATHFVLHEAKHVQPLPMYVLNYRRGYIPRIHEAPYKIVKTHPKMMVNGQLEEGFSQAVAFAPGAKAAQRVSDGLEEAGATFRAEPTRELINSTDELASAYENARANGRLYFSKRGEELPGLYGKRTVGNITDSMSRVIASVSKHKAMGDMMDEMQASWMKSYREFLSTAHQKDGVFPQTVADLVPPADISKSDKYGRAVAHMGRINHLNGQNNGLGVKQYRTIVKWFSNMIEATSDESVLARSRNALSHKLLDAKSSLPFTINNSPLSAFKAASFISVIALNPVRQFMVNAAQISVYAGVDGGLAYMTNFSRQGYVSQQSMLLAGLLSEHLPAAGRLLARERAANMSNLMSVGGIKVTAKHIDELTADFLRTGLPQNIDGHQFLQATAVDRADGIIGGNFLTTAGKITKEVLINKPIALGKAAGFKAGEILNLSAAYLVSRNSYAKKFPNVDISGKEATEYLSGRASEISYNMNRSGEVAYQKGILSGYFQYMSVVQKAAQALIPNIGPLKKIAGKQFSNAEKLRIGIIQTGLFGTAGTGLTGMYDWLVGEADVDIPPEVNEIIKGGFTDYMVNGVAERMTGQAQKLQAAEGLAPISALGSMGGEGGIVDSAWKMVTEGPEFTDLMGASGNLVGKFSLLLESIHYAAQMEMADQEADYDIIFEDAASLFSSGASNYFKAKLNMKFGREITASGYAKFKTTDFEQWGKGLFGFQNTLNSDINTLSMSFIKKTKKDESGVPAALEADANNILTMMNRVALRKASGEIGHEKYKETLRAISMITNMAYDYGEMKYLREYMYRKLMKEDRQKGGEINFFTNLIKGVGDGWLSTKDGLINRVRKGPDWEGKEAFINIIDAEVPEVGKE